MNIWLYYYASTQHVSTFQTSTYSKENESTETTLLNVNVRLVWQCNQMLGWPHSYSQFGSHILLQFVSDRYGNLVQNRHLLVLDGHGSHMMLEVVQKAHEEGLDIIILPSHISHRLQPLNGSIFKSFKVAFWACKGRWTMHNKGKGAWQSGFHGVWERNLPQQRFRKDSPWSAFSPWIGGRWMYT